MALHEGRIYFEGTAAELVASQGAYRTLIVSTWAAQQKPDQKDASALWGAYGYTPAKDVARVPMRIEALPSSVEQLTWAFLDMTAAGGRVAISWARTMASAAFTAQMP